MTLPPIISRFLHWLDEHILIILAGFLIAFIPLYPKLPLFEAIPGYIVRVRLEDILIFFTVVVWAIQVIRRKVQWRTPVFWMMAAYGVVGLLSVVSAVLITQTVPAETLHIAKTVLHYFRYIEYFSLFVIVFSAIKNRQQAQVLLAVFALTVLAIVLYGYGQKYYYWPVYSTMNREFSKGLRLYLTEHARVQSTFGGHYDLAAYLVVALPLLLSLAFVAKRWIVKLPLQVIHWLGVWLLIVSASRTSFIAYFVGVLVVISGLAWLQPGIWRKFKWWVSRLAFVGIVASLMMVSFGEDMYERFLQVLQGYPVAWDTYHNVNRQRKLFVEEPVQFVVNLLPKAEKPDDAISTEEMMAIEQPEPQVLVPSDQRPVAVRPSDVYVDVPDIVEVATISASGAATTIQVDKGPRTYSQCALEKGLSLCIRLDTLWPRAIEGFKRNPIFGSGYATLTKESIGQFTEAESTDNNFLRTLGETGLAGFITFYGVIALTLWVSLKHLRDQDSLARALSVGYLGASIGLLLNAVYIDVYAASKVALTYWALSGIVVGYLLLIAKHPLWTADSIVATEGEMVTPPSSTKSPKPRRAAKRKRQFKNV